MERSSHRTLAFGLASGLVLSLLALESVAAQTGDPVLVTADDAATGDLFGCAFDLAATPGVPGLGGILLVGSLQDDDRGADSGSVILFELTPDGWTERAKGLAGAGAPGDLLGYDVALGRGSYLAGAPGADSGRGRLHLFLGPDETGFLGEGAVLADPSGQPGAGFGTSLAVGGSLQTENVLVAVGAPGTDDGRGAAYLVGQGRSSLGPALALVPPETARNPGDGLGWAVAISGSVVVVGAPWGDTPTTDAGGVQLFDTQGRYLESVLAPEAGAFDAFGYSLAATETRFAVGAPRSHRGGPGSGAVYVYARSANPRERFRLEEILVGEAGEQLGTSVTFEGPNRLAAGARNAAGRTGLVRRYGLSDNGWSQTGTFRPPGVLAGDELGIAVAASGDLLAAGAYRDDVDGLVDAGSVWVTERVVPPPLGTNLAVTSLTASPVVGGSLSVAFTVAHTGPDPVTGVPLVFSDPTGILSAATWTCTASSGSTCSPAGGTGLPAGTVSLEPDGTATVTVTAVPTPGLFGSFPVTVGVAPSPGLDTEPTDDTGTVTVTVPAPPTAALSASLGVGQAVPGQPVTYTLVVANGGPAPAPAVPLAFAAPRLRSPTWTCTATGGSCAAAAGSGLPAGSTVTLSPTGTATVTVTGTLAPALTGVVPVTGGVVPPAGLDPDPSDDRATLVTVLEPQATLTFSSLFPATLSPSSPGSLTLTLGNTGPSTVTGARVREVLQDGLVAGTWSCTASAGATCGTGGTTAGAIDDTITMPPGSTLVYTAGVAASAGHLGLRVVELQVGPTTPVGVGGDTAVFEVPLTLIPAGGLGLTLEIFGDLRPGGEVIFGAVFANGGPGTVPDGVADEISLPLPSSLLAPEAFATQGTEAISAGSLTWNGTLAAGDLVAVFARGTLAPGLPAGSQISGQATATTPLAPNGLLLSSPPGASAPEPTVAQVRAVEIPTASTWALGLLAFALALLGLRTLTLGGTP